MENIGKISTDFSRGLNQAASQTIGVNECQFSENFVFKDRSATVRQGIQVFGSLPAPVVALQKFYDKNGGNYFFSVAGGRVYNSVTSGEFVSISSEPISGNVQNAVYDGAIYFTDYNTPVKWFNGGSVGVAGLSSPAFRLQINDMENVNGWTNNTLGRLEQDFNYLHRDDGDSSITFYASSPSTAAVFQIGGGTELINLVSNSASVARKTPSCRDLSGNIYVAWVGNQGWDVYLYKSLDKGSSWTDTHINFYTSSSRIDYPTLAVDSSNTLHFIYGINFKRYAYYGIAYNNYHELSGWGTEQVVVSGDLSSYYIYMKAHVDLSNDIHVITQHRHNTYQNVAYIRRSFSGDWTSLSTINSSGFNTGINAPNMAIDASNIRHVIFNALCALSAQSTIQYVNSLSSNTQDITSGVPYGKWNPCIACDTSGNVHVAFEGVNTSSGLYNYDVEYKKKTNNGPWGSITNLTLGVENDYPQTYISIALDANNGVHLMWMGKNLQSPSYNQIRYAKNLSGWSAVQNLTTAARDQNFPSFLYSYHPVVAGNRVDRPNTGWAFFWSDGVWDLKYHASYDLLWDGDPIAPRQLDLTHFAPDTSSDINDIVQLFTCHHVKSAISSLVLQFTDYSNLTATREITSLSTWQSCSNDEWGLQHSIPKTTFTLNNPSFNWASCNIQINMTALSTNPQVTAQCAIDNIRLLKTPPILDYSTSTAAKSNLLFFGSSAVQGLAHVPPPTPWWMGMPLVDQNAANVALLWMLQNQPKKIDPLQLEGLKLLSDPLPSATYYYKTTFLSQAPSGFEIESNPTEQTSSYVINNAASSWTYIHLTDIPIAPQSMNVQGRRIYRRKSDDDTFQNVYTIHDNVTTNFLDTVPQVTLGKALEEDHNAPPQAKLMFRASNNVMYYFNVIEDGNTYPSRIRYSKPYEPYYCPSQNIADAAPDDGSEGTGIFEFNGVVHLLKNRSAWTIDDNGILSNTHHTVGCIASHSVVVGKNEVFWLAEEGIIKYNLYRWDNISHSLDGGSKYRIQTILDRLPKDYLSNAVGTYYNGYYLLAVTDVGSTTNNLVLCYDVDNDIWTVFPNLNVNCWSTWTGGKDGYRLFFGNNSGLVCEMFAGDCDISTPISWGIQTKEFGMPSPQEFFRKGYLFARDLDGNQKTVNILPFYDFVPMSSFLDQKDLTLASGQASVQKIDFQMTEPPSFFSLRFSGSGRVKINTLDLYGKAENLR